MLSTGEIIQRIQSLYSKGSPSDDSRLTSRHIYSKMLTVRSKLLTQKVKKRQLINDWNYQILPCVKLIKVPPYDCPCVPMVGCKVSRIEHPLPKPLASHNNHVIDWILSLENSIKFEETNRKAYRDIRGNRFTAKKPHFILENGYIYFYGPALPKVVKIKLLAEDPLEADKYPSFCPSDEEPDCTSPLDMDFPLDLDLVDTLIEMSVNELIVMFSQSVEDLTNNAKDTPTEQAK